MNSIREKTAIQIDLLKLFSVLWFLAKLFSLSQTKFAIAIIELQFSAIFLIPIVIACVVGLLRPSSIRCLVAVAILYCIYFLYSLPNSSNHRIMFFMVDVTIISVYVWQWAHGEDSRRNRKAFFEAFAPVGRYLLLMMYFYGTFHKLNTDWLNPEVSCGIVAINTILKPLGLNGLVTDMTAIYGTLILEAAAIFFLCTPRLKYLGFLIGIPFHLMIALFPMSWFMGFSAMVLAFYSLFLPDSFGDRLSEFITRITPYRRTLVIIILVGLIGFSVVLIGANIYGPASGSQLVAGIGKNTYWVFVSGLFVSIGVTYLALVLKLTFGLHSPTTWRYWVPRPMALLVLPVIFFVNGFAPYIGLKTQATFSMFSNLHTEGGKTNHIFFNKPPYLFNYQSEIVHVLEAPPEFVRRSQAQARRRPDGRFTLVGFDFWDYLHRYPSTFVTYVDRTGIHKLERAEAVLRDHPLPWVLRKIFAFKPVDFTRPKICSN